MIPSITTSIRLPAELRQELERAAKKQHRGKNWLIIEAIRAYFKRTNPDTLANEAKQQSILASRRAHPEDEAWEHAIDWED